MDAIYNNSTIHPIGLSAVLLLGFALLFIPRHWAIVPFFLIACFIPSAQRIVVVGLDFNFIRTLVVFGFLRLLIQREWASLRFNRVDAAVLTYSIVSTIMHFLQGMQVENLIFKLGESFEFLGCYFIIRCLIRGCDDVRYAARALAVIVAPVVLAFFVEAATGRNAFSVFGGVPQITAIREGRLRCQGAFSHSILAGTFWALIAPWMAALWFGRSRNDKFLAVTGVLGCMILIVLCSSSTPVATFGVGMVGAALWFIRGHMRLFRWGLVATLIALHMVMKAPVWNLIARIDIVGGSTGYHRYRLIDAAIRNFSDWMVFGVPSTAYWGWHLFDVTNQFILEGVRGGVLGLGAFILMITFAFQAIGKARTTGRVSRSDQILIWAIGITLGQNVVTFFAVAYFGQILLLWAMTLAFAGSFLQEARLRQAAERRVVLAKRARALRAAALTRPVRARQA